MKDARDEDNKGHVVLGLGELKELMQEAVRETRHDSMSSEIALRLANVEAKLTQLLEQRRVNVRAGTKRTQSAKLRVQNEALAHPERPHERHHPPYGARPQVRPGWVTKLGIKRRRFHDFRDTAASHLLSGSWGARWSLADVSASSGTATQG